MADSLGVYKQSRSLTTQKRKKLFGDVVVHGILYIVLSLVGISMLIPFFWMLSTSLKPLAQVFVLPPQWIPEPFMWQNYVDAWTRVPFATWYLNSAFVAIVVTAGQVFTSALAAYAFSRLHFPGRDKLFFAYLATMMIPGSVTMIPVFILCKTLGMVDTYAGLIIPGMFSAYGTFLLRQFFMGLPTELEDAAKIDGCSLFGIFRQVIVPLSKPALATLTTFTFMGSWGSFLWPLIMTNSIEMKTLPVGLFAFMGMYNCAWTMLMAGSVMATIPVLLVFLFNQRFFVAGIQLGAVKG